jgi:hypothetical protein
MCNLVSIWLPNIQVSQRCRGQLLACHNVHQEILSKKKTFIRIRERAQSRKECMYHLVRKSKGLHGPNGRSYFSLEFESSIQSSADLGSSNVYSC